MKALLGIIFANAPRRGGSYPVQGESIKINFLERHVFIKNGMSRQAELCARVRFFNNPVLFLNIASPLDRARGHLLANRLGGHGTQENLVTLYQTANIRMRDLAETPVANALASGKYDEVCYFSNAVYNSTDGYPQAVEIIAYGIKNGQIEQQPFVAITILNQK